MGVFPMLISTRQKNWNVGTALWEVNTIQILAKWLMFDSSFATTYRHLNSTVNKHGLLKPWTMHCGFASHSHMDLIMPFILWCLNQQKFQYSELHKYLILSAKTRKVLFKWTLSVHPGWSHFRYLYKGLWCGVWFDVMACVLGVWMYILKLSCGKKGREGEKQGKTKIK